VTADGGAATSNAADDGRIDRRRLRRQPATVTQTTSSVPPASTRTTTTVSVHLSGTCYFSYADATLDMPSASVYISSGASGAISCHTRCHCDEAGSYYADMIMYTTKLSECGQTVRRGFTYIHSIIMVCQHRRQCRLSSHRRR